MMRQDAILINTCRGPVVDEPAVAKALDERRLWGYGADVYTVEPPPPGHPLIGRDDVILTPHSAAQTEEGLRNMATTIAQEVVGVLTATRRPIRSTTHRSSRRCAAAWGCPPCTTYAARARLFQSRPQIARGCWASVGAVLPPRSPRRCHFPDDLAAVPAGRADDPACATCTVAGILRRALVRKLTNTGGSL